MSWRRRLRKPARKCSDAATMHAAAHQSRLPSLMCRRRGWWCHARALTPPPPPVPAGWCPSKSTTFGRHRREEIVAGQPVGVALVVDDGAGAVRFDEDGGDGRGGKRACTTICVSTPAAELGRALVAGCHRPGSRVRRQGGGNMAVVEVVIAKAATAIRRRVPARASHPAGDDRRQRPGRNRRAPTQRTSMCRYVPQGCSFLGECWLAWSSGDAGVAAEAAPSALRRYRRRQNGIQRLSGWLVAMPSAAERRAAEQYLLFSASSGCVNFTSLLAAPFGRQARTATNLVVFRRGGDDRQA